MPSPTGIKLIAENRRSRHDYELLEKIEAGIVLSGTEVKALRAGHAQIGQAFADVRNGEMWLIGASISEYAQGNRVLIACGVFRSTPTSLRRNGMEAETAWMPRKSSFTLIARRCVALLRNCRKPMRVPGYC